MSKKIVSVIHKGKSGRVSRVSLISRNDVIVNSP